MAEITNWRAVKVPHGYKDGTTHTWEVHADGYDIAGSKMNILLGSWLTEPSAHLIAASPDLYAALKAMSEFWAYGLNKPAGAKLTKHDLDRVEELGKAAAMALAKAEGKPTASPDEGDR